MRDPGQKQKNWKWIYFGLPLRLIEKRDGGVDTKSFWSLGGRRRLLVSHLLHSQFILRWRELAKSGADKDKGQALTSYNQIWNCNQMLCCVQFSLDSLTVSFWLWSLPFPESQWPVCWPIGRSQRHLWCLVYFHNFDSATWTFTNFSKILTLLHQHSVIIRCCALRRSNLRLHSNRVLSRPRENIYHQTRSCCWRWRDWVHIIHVLSFHVHRIISNDSSNCFVLEAYRYCHNSKPF